MSKVLLVEDEARMAQALVELLRQEGSEADWFEDGPSGLAALESGIYDVAVLDVMIPEMNGFQVVKRARAAGVRTPVLMLTARTSTDDKVCGLDAGADDYLTKPFSPREFLARVRALNRRGSGAVGQEGPAFGDIVLDPGDMSVTCTTTGESTRLGDKEFRILEYMVANAGLILTRQQLASKVWGYDDESEYNNVEVYMSFTRKKLAFVGSKVEIKAVRGVGYELRFPEGTEGGEAR